MSLRNLQIRGFNEVYEYLATGQGLILAQARSVVLTPSWKLSGGKYLAIRSGAAVGL